MSLFDFFRKPGAPAAQPDPQPDIEELIWRIAEYGKAADQELLWRLMPGRQIYVPADLSSLPAHVAPGETFQTTASERVMMRCTTGPGGHSFTCAATRPDHPILREGYVGMEWLGFLQMTAKLGPEIVGFLLQGQRSWVGGDRAQIDALLRSV